MSFRFETSVRPVGGVADATVCHLSGSLDATSVREAQRGFGQVAAGRPQMVVLDLAGLEFIDSSGISAVLSARNELKKIGTNVVLTNLQKQIKKVFDIVKALPGVPIFQSTAEFDAYLAKIQDPERESE